MQQKIDLFQDEYAEESKDESGVHKNHLLDTITIEKEENEIQAKERELMLKAK